MAPAERVRVFPHHGWLAAVTPADARRFCVSDPDLATTLAHAGAEIVEASPDVEIVTHGDSDGLAPCVIVPLRSRELADRPRLVRGLQRVVRSTALRPRIERVRRALLGSGYEVDVLRWERGLRLTSSRSTSSRSTVPLAHALPLHAAVVGRRRGTGGTLYQASIAAAGHAVGHEVRPQAPVLGASGVMVAAAEDVVLRVAVGPAAARIEEQQGALDRLRLGCPGKVVAERVPWTLAGGRVGLATWSAERRLPGTKAAATLPPSVLADCLDFLVAMHAITDGGRASSAADAELVATLCPPQQARAVHALGREVDDSLSSLPHGFVHGDFWHGNLLVVDGRLSGVVDWPAAHPGGLPLLDLLHLQATSLSEQSGRQLGSILVDDLLPRARTGGDELIRAYCRRIGVQLGPDELTLVLGAYWLNAIARELVDPDRDPEDATRGQSWRVANVDAVAQTLAPSGRRRVVRLG